MNNQFNVMIRFRKGIKKETLLRLLIIKPLLCRIFTSVLRHNFSFPVKNSIDLFGMTLDNEQSI